MKKKILIMLICILFPLNVFAYSNFIIPGGNNIGIDVKNNGVIVIGFYKINNKYINNDLKIGDTIIKINDTNVYTVNEMIEAIQENVKDNKVNITVKRNDKEKTIEFKLKNEGGTYKTGLYVKDSISGIGTLTYIDPETKIYGALGHEIIESNSMNSVEVKEGTIFKSIVTSIDRSSVGSAGTKNAKFYANNKYGTVNKNTISGIYGIYNDKLPNKELMEVGEPSDLKLGEAKIYTVLDGESVEEFDIEITKINNTSNIKNISFKITDERLLNETGGIVQGMSGSPIIQDNKIYGAVTHVIINNPSTGYGIFITTMLSEGEKE
ncbi:MAG: SpoIVB peptidase [Bacilli bacterium]|nr:SpoIVB peptidase [Bacilli bacterium]